MTTPLTPPADAPDLDNLARLVAGWTAGTLTTADAVDSMLNALPALLADHARLTAEVARLRGVADEAVAESIWRIENETRAAKERDAAIQRAERVEADTVARIVSMIRAKVQHLASLRPYDEYRSGGADSLDVLADDIEAGAWRGKEGA